ncbi:MAG: hypothetical protein QOC95_2138 [Thermoleophilaceae bacterium]|jgi:hypothetical protein|nr:hypothetical protein [Thermoleophilaceae bacterium]
MRANVYIDGFNFYYGAARTRPKCKWTDLAMWAQNCLVLPGDQLNRIRYFTARVSGTPANPSQPQRQETYFRALRTIPNLSIHEGQFQRKTVRMPRANGTGTVEVIKTEEKGSDVNLATYVMLDGAQKDAEVAIVVSDDFDLREPLTLAPTELGLRVGVVSPRGQSWLRSAVKADFYRPVREADLLACQFPNQLQDAQGRTLRRPPSWS